MSTVEEDVELRDLVAQTLEKNGCLGKIRAKLRASIFLALDEEIKLSQQQPFQNLRIQSYLETAEGRAMFGLVREFLDFFNLQHTIAVYEPESYLESIGQYEGRQKIAKDLGLENTAEPTVPLLQQLLKIAQAKSKILDINLNVNTSSINGSYVDDSINNDSSYRKTETFNTLPKTLSNIESNPLPLENTQFLNETFDLNSPTINLSHLGNIRCEDVSVKNILRDVIQEGDSFKDNSSIKEDSNRVKGSNQSLNSLSNLDSGSLKGHNTFSAKNENLNDNIRNNLQVDIGKEQNGEVNKKVAKEDDTYEDTSSIAEDSIAVANTNSSKTKEISEKEFSNIFKSSEHSLQLLKPEEKPKLSPQRPKTSLSSLADLPPLSVNKSRVSNDILPSLYSKDFKSKSNLKDLDKMFDMDAEYEEDFLYSSSQLSLNASQPMNLGQTKTGLPDEQGPGNRMDSEKLNTISKKENKTVSDKGRSVLRPSVPKTCSNLLKSCEQSTNGSISEHSLSD